MFIEAFRPGVAAKLGFDCETVRQYDPRVVYVSLTAFGQTGPYRDVPAHDLACEALAGAISVNLGQDGQPAMPQVPVADFAAASIGLAGVLMALERREKTGAGDRLDISMHDAALAWLPNVLGPVFVERRAPVPQHERTWGGSAFYRIHRTSRQWSTSCRACSRPGRSPSGSSGSAAVTYASRRCRTCARHSTTPQAQARGMRLVDELGQEQIGLPVKFEAEPGRADFRVPRPGEHTEQVLRSAGCSDVKLAAPRAAGAF